MIFRDLLFRAMPMGTDQWFILPKGASVHLSLQYCFTCLMRRRISNYFIFFTDEDSRTTWRPRDAVIRTNTPIGKWRPVHKAPIQELLDRSFVRQMENSIKEPDAVGKLKTRRERYYKSLKKLQGLVDRLPETSDEIHQRRFLPVQASGG
jgi:hypothetical protein